MKRILVLGAGKSATALIDYLIDRAPEYNWLIVIADRDKELAESKIEERPNAEALALDIMQEDNRATEIQKADFVISLLPPFLHIHIARDCVKLKTNLATASYVSDELLELDEAAKEAGIVLMNEIGADPGLDHMSAMELIDNIRSEGGKVTSFQSYCGGLVAPESDTNPWHYKVSWNPWNIVRAGGAGANFLMNGQEYYRAYEQLYKECSTVEVDNYGTLAAYANRDSLKYQDDYELVHAHTILRATLRHPDFVKGWAAVISLGLTNAEKTFDVSGMKMSSWFLQATENTEGSNLKEKLKTIEADELAFELINNLGLNSDNEVGLQGEQAPAKVMQKVIEEKWKLSPDDKDLLVFHHDIEYEQDGDSKQLQSSLLVKGTNQTDTAMAKCVGLPMAIFTKLFLTQGFENLRGVQIPTMKRVYKPILEELKEFNIEFVEK